MRSVEPQLIQGPGSLVSRETPRRENREQRAEPPWVRFPALRRIVQAEQQEQARRNGPDRMPHQWPRQRVQRERECRTAPQCQGARRQHVWTAECPEQQRVQADQSRRIERLKVAVRDLAVQHAHRLLDKVALVEVVDAEPQDRRLADEAGANHAEANRRRQPTSAVFSGTAQVIRTYASTIMSGLGGCD